MAKIEGDCLISCDIGVKRFYMPGVVIKDVCVKCGEEVAVDLGVTCIYYPSLNNPTDVGFSCSAEHEWSVPVMICASIKVL